MTGSGGATGRWSTSSELGVRILGGPWARANYICPFTGDIARWRSTAQNLGDVPPYARAKMPPTPRIRSPSRNASIGPIHESSVDELSVSSLEEASSPDAVSGWRRRSRNHNRGVYGALAGSTHNGTAAAASADRRPRRGFRDSACRASFVCNTVGMSSSTSALSAASVTAGAALSRAIDSTSDTGSLVAERGLAWPVLRVSAMSEMSLFSSSCSVPGSQSTRRTVWSRLNSRGILMSSIHTGCRIPRVTPSEASDLTQSEETEYFDQRTTTHLALSSSNSMTSSKLRPVRMRRSQKTVQPRSAKSVARREAQT
jgi:hypothetical protein